MSEGLGPSPEDMGVDPEENENADTVEPGLLEERETEDTVALKEVLRYLKELGAELNDDSLPIAISKGGGDSLVSMPPGEFLEDEVVVGPDGRHYTREGILTEKVIARETYFKENAVSYPKLNLGDSAFLDGMLAAKKGRIGTISELTLVADPLYPKKKQPTLPKMTLTYADGTTEETFAMGVTAVYQSGLKKLSETQLAEHANQLQIEHSKF